MEFDNVRLLVNKFDDCFQFYREQLGFSVLWGEMGGGYASFGTVNGKSFAIFSRAEMAQVVGVSYLLAISEAQDRFVLILKVGDLEQVVAGLKAKGIVIITEIQARPSWGIRTAHLRDPDGNLLELFDEIPPEECDQGLREADEKYRTGQ